MLHARLFISLYVCLSLSLLCRGAALTLDGTKLERTFDGIGGLSGGGATSRFIFDYQEPYRSQILDYLFLPNFGASLQILKVEIGGDGQTTEGTEPSHMHTRDDLNYHRGYEWSLMVEAKKRNPSIQLYALSWSAPGWVGDGGQNYYTTDNINYHIKWLEGARDVYNLTIDYMGVWNERDYNMNWVEELRTALDQNKFADVKIVASDQGWNVADDMVKNSTFNDAIAIVGAHYPGTTSTSNAQSLKKPLWASEDYSSYSDSNGGGCWGRILNQNYVNGYITATISWNLVSAYYNTVPWGGDGLMWAPSPWTGHYDVQSPIWISAHTTQFAQPGWIYLAHGSGTGHLPEGGSYVTLVPSHNPNGDFSLIIETFSRDNSVCVRPNLPPFNVSAQTVSFSIGAGLSRSKTLYVWKTHLSPSGENSYFQFIEKITPTDGDFTLQLDIDSVWSITTTTGQQKGSHPAPPADAPFPDSYVDSFANYTLYSEAHYWTDMTGTFEINTGVDGKPVMRQTVLEDPVEWCWAANRPISVFGKFTSGNVAVSVDGLIEGATGSVNIGARVINTGCWTDTYSNGYFLNLNYDGTWTLLSGTTALKQGKLTGFKTGQWITLSLSVSGNQVCGSLGSTQTGCATDNNPRFGGFVSIGSGWNYTQFRNFAVKTQPGKGCPAQSNYLTLDICDDSLGRQKWTLAADGTIRLTNTTYCLQVEGQQSDGYKTVQALTCNPSLPSQKWQYVSESFINVGTGQCLDIDRENSAPCLPLGIYECKGNSYPGQSWGFSDDDQIVDIYSNPGLFCVTATNVH